MFSALIKKVAAAPQHVSYWVHLSDSRLRLPARTILLLTFGISHFLVTHSLLANPSQRPNIVLIMADDMGYGDPACYNTESKCVTPNIDRLANEGMRFTDAHTAGAVCVPSRYGLLTGRYPFRRSMNSRVQPVIDADRLTLPAMLKSAGYDTSMVGKWHLGFEGGPDYDYSKPMLGGPANRGFNRFFGMHASLDIPPYFYMAGTAPVLPPTDVVGDSNTAGWSKIQGAFWRGGPVAPDFKHDEVLDRFANETLIEVSRLSQSETPFFLYMALPAPHTPWLPAEKFRGIGEAGMYSEFVAHVDDVIGRVLFALDQHQLKQNTIVIFTSDNGPVWYDVDKENCGHASVGALRGMKGDAWEGGHRVPFIVRWPSVVAADSTSDHLIGFVDTLATVAEMLGVELPENAAEDSVSFLSSLKQTAKASSRESIVLHHSGTVIRDGNWKLINHLGSGGFSPPRKVKAEKNGPRGQLYNLKDDLGETKNLWQQEPERVEKMLNMLAEIKQ